jgi:hypothetical protein
LTELAVGADSEVGDDVAPAAQRGTVAESEPGARSRRRRREPQHQVLGPGRPSRPRDREEDDGVAAHQVGGRFEDGLERGLARDAPAAAEPAGAVEQAEASLVCGADVGHQPSTGGKQFARASCTFLRRDDQQASGGRRRGLPRADSGTDRARRSDDGVERAVGAETQGNREAACGDGFRADRPSRRPGAGRGSSAGASESRSESHRHGRPARLRSPRSSPSAARSCARSWTFGARTPPAGAVSVRPLRRSRSTA